MSNHFVQFGKKWKRVGGIFFGVGERATRSLQRCVKYVHVFFGDCECARKKMCAEILYSICKVK